MRHLWIAIMLLGGVCLVGCDQPRSPAGKAEDAGAEAEAGEPDATPPEAAKIEGPVEVVQVAPPAGESEGSAPEGEAEEEGVTGAEVVRDVKRAADTGVRYAADKSRRLADAAKSQLRKLDERTEAWRDEAKEKAGRWSEATKQRWRRAMENMEEQKKKAKEKWERLKDHGDDAWAAGWAGFQKAMTEAERAYENARSEWTKESAKDPADRTSE